MNRLTDKTIAYIDRQDANLNKLAGWESNDIKGNISKLLEFGRVEVGYRSSCGSTDKTQKIYNAFNKVLRKMAKDGITVAEATVKHGNAYATSKGGFWNSTIYTLS